MEGLYERLLHGLDVKIDQEFECLLKNKDMCERFAAFLRKVMMEKIEDFEGKKEKVKMKMERIDKCREEALQRKAKDCDEFNKSCMESEDILVRAWIMGSEKCRIIHMLDEKEKEWEESRVEEERIRGVLWELDTRRAEILEEIEKGEKENQCLEEMFLLWNEDVEKNLKEIKEFEIGICEKSEKVKELDEKIQSIDMEAEEYRESERGLRIDCEMLREEMERLMKESAGRTEKCGICGKDALGRMKKCQGCQRGVHAKCIKDAKFWCWNCKKM